MTPTMRVGRMRRWAKWLRGFRETKRRHFDIRLIRVRSHCNTAACAIGWLPQIFPERWVALREDGYMPRLMHSLHRHPGPIDDARSFFGLTSYQMARIALWSSYNDGGAPVTPVMVADRIDEIIAERGKGKA